MTDFETLAAQARALLDGEPDWIANAANFSALVFAELENINWSGFYFLQGDTLVVGPFQGKPACVRILLGQGVCGTAASERRTLRVPDVHAFAGHIACDAASRSEIVIPLIVNDNVLGVFDIDSPLADRFSGADQQGLEHLVSVFMELAARP